MWLERIESGRLVAHQASVTSEPFSILGVVEVEHIYVSTSPGAADGIDVPTLHELGALSSTPAIGTRSLDVTVALQEDYARGAQRGQYSQYRLVERFAEPAPSLSHYASFTCSAFALETTYLLP